MKQVVESPTAAAEVLRDFINTRDIENKRDELSTSTALLDWLMPRGLLTHGAAVRRRDLALATELREGLRTELLKHDGAPVASPAVLAEISRQLPLVVDFSQEPPGFMPVDQGVRGGLAALLALVAISGRDDSWNRLKVCAADDCRWAFVDTSRNRSRTWCAMGVCGNRRKTRTYRERHRQTG